MKCEEWKPLETPADLDNLMRVSGSFHDACLHEIHLATGHYVAEDLSLRVEWGTTVRMLFQRQFRDPVSDCTNFRMSLASPGVAPFDESLAKVYHISAMFFSVL